MHWFFRLSFALCCFLGCSRNTEHTPSNRALKIALPSDPSTLDPRLARDLISVDIASLLFTGLTRNTNSGSTEKALAEKIEKSPDNLSYTITLKNAFWSDSKPITADDVEYSWKSVLQKQRACPNAFQLFWIKGAKEAYMNTLPLDEVGVRALDSKTLSVTLERPCPFFEKLLSTSAYLPIQKDYDLSHASSWDKESFPCSGPFRLSKWKFTNSIVLTKNPFHCFQSIQPCEELSFAILDKQTALAMFEAGELDLTGSPFGNIPSDALKILSDQRLLQYAPAAGTAFLRVNTQAPILSDSRIRQAIFYAIDRKALVDDIFHGNQQPALTLSPPYSSSIKTARPFCNIAYAKKLLQDYCDDHECSAASISLNIICSSTETPIKVAESIQGDLKSNLGISVNIHPKDSQLLYSEINALKYDLALGSWFADYDDPHSFYSVFESSTNGTNNTGWQDSQYVETLARSLTPQLLTDRQKYFFDLEQILLDQMPVVPLYHFQFNYLASKQAQQLMILPTGQIYTQTI